MNFVSANNIDAYVSVIDAQQSTMSLIEQEAYQKRILALLSLQMLRVSSDNVHFPSVVALYDRLSHRFASIDLLEIPKTSVTEEKISVSNVVLSMDIPYVDVQKIREAWIQWHNTERTSLWLAPLVYHPALESTAMTWANYLAQRRWTTHRRHPSDPYYSYPSIKQRFLDQGIVFAWVEQSGQSLFTENLAWNVYSCKKSDCTDDLIAAIRKWRNFFMSEKWRPYRAHYNAIVGHFTTIGLWIAFAGNRYYLVSHYTQDLQ